MDTRILLRSVDRRDPAVSTSSNFLVNFVDPLVGTYRLTWAAIPATIYNVTAANNTLYWDVGGGGRLQTITAGYYTPTTLAAAVKAAMDTPGPEVYTVTYSATTGKLTITTTANWGFTFLTNQAASAQKVIGAQVADKVQALSFELDYPVNLGLPLSIGVGIDNVGTRGYWTALQFHASFYVPLVAGFGAYQTLENDTLPQLIRINTPTRYLHVTLRNVDNNDLADVNNSDWEMLLTRIA